MKYFLFILLIQLPTLLFSQQQGLAFSIHNEGHAAPVHRILVSPKTNEIITVSEDKSIAFWDAEDFSLKSIKHLNGGYGKTGVFYDACFLNDSNYVALVGNNISSVDSINYIHLLNIKDKSIEKVATKSSVIKHCISSYNGKELYLTDNTNQLEVLRFNKNTLNHHSIDSLPFSVKAIRITKSGRFFLASTTSNYLYHGNLEAIASNSLSVSTHHYQPIQELVYAPKHDQIITYGADLRINIYSSEGKFLLKLCDVPNPINNLQISRDENILLGGEENTGNVTFYNFNNGKVIANSTVFDNSVFSSSFLENQTNLLAIVSGGSQHEIAVIQPLLGKQLHQLGGKGTSIKQMDWVDGKLYFSNSDQNKYLYEFFDFNEIRIGKDKGQQINNTLEAYQKDAYNLKIEGIKIRSNEKLGRILSWEKYNNRYFIGTDHYLLVYSEKGKLEQKMEAHIRGIRSLCVGAFNEQTYLFSSGEDEMIHMWPLDSTHLPQSPKASLYINFNREWILWTERGYFTSSEQGASLVGFPSKTALGTDRFSTMDEFFEVLYKPEVVKENIKTNKSLHRILEEHNQHEVDLSTIKGASYAVIDKFYTIDKDGEKNYLAYQKTGYPTKEATVYFDIEATDGGAGIKEINVLCNGKLVVTDDSLPHTKLNETIHETYAVQLLPGDNKIEVYAVNYQQRSSVKLGVNVIFEGAVKANAKLYALVIGINEYTNEKNNLNYAYSDAISVQEKLESISGSIFSSVDVTLLLNKEASKSNIEASLKNIAQSASPNDVFIFYFAGHGILISENNHSEYYLAPSELVQMYDTEEHLNALAISTASFRKSLSEIKAQKQLILLDACHSGGAVDKFKTRGSAQEKSIFQLARSSGVVLIAASESEQYATEFDELGHGVFTYTFLEALSGKADTINEDKKITVSELKAYMEDQVPEISAKYGDRKQYPTGFSTGQDFPIGVLTDIEE